jgi:hypothetical protein
MSWLCQTLTMRILVVSEEFDANTLLEVGSMKSIFRQATVGSYCPEESQRVIENVIEIKRPPGLMADKFSSPLGIRAHGS